MKSQEYIDELAELYRLRDYFDELVELYRQRDELKVDEKCYETIGELKEAVTDAIRRTLTEMLEAEK